MAFVPSWWSTLPYEERPRLPLPGGVEFSEEPFTYLGKGGMTFVYVPPGHYMRSPLVSDRSDSIGGLWIREGFFIGKCEVALAAYLEYCNDAGMLPPLLLPEELEIPGQRVRVPTPPRKTLPIHGVTWRDALAFCHWMGGRLPAWEEWVCAASGPLDWDYPWGPRLGNRLQFNFADRDVSFPYKPSSPFSDGSIALAPVGSYPAGASACRALDMSGNVWEWTGNVESLAMTCGGGWHSVPAECKVRSRRRTRTGLRADDVGFRVVIASH